MSINNTIEEKMDKMFAQVFDRLREVEAQSREQNVRLESITSGLEVFTSVTDKFVAHLGKQEERSEKREQNFFKAIAILIGAIVALALGPKVAKELYSAWKPTTATAIYPCDIWHGDGDRRCWPIIANRTKDNIA